MISCSSFLSFLSLYVEKIRYMSRDNFASSTVCIRSWRRLKIAEITEAEEREEQVSWSSKFLPLFSLSMKPVQGKGERVAGDFGYGEFGKEKISGKFLSKIARTNNFLLFFPFPALIFIPCSSNIWGTFKSTAPVLASVEVIKFLQV